MRYSHYNMMMVRNQFLRLPLINLHGSYEILPNGQCPSNDGEFKDEVWKLRHKWFRLLGHSTDFDSVCQMLKRKM